MMQHDLGCLIKYELQPDARRLGTDSFSRTVDWCREGEGTVAGAAMVASHRIDRLRCDAAMAVS